VFEPLSVRIDAPIVAPQKAQGFLNAALDWFGDDIEDVAWSFHLGEKFYSQLLLRNRLMAPPPRLERSIAKQLESTPRDILSLIQHMNPQQVGPRKVIGRVPAMAKTYALQTALATGPRMVSMVTALPERAAPNLALGTLLAWDESTRTDFSKGPVSTQPAKQPALPDTIAARLKLKIDVDFRNEPLHQAIDFIAEETGTTFKIEGNDLKEIGVTQNMKQQFKMDNVPATAVLHHMLDKLGLVIVVDEQKKLITLTSAKAAVSKKLTPFPLAPAK
jgi:hypothetical protein